MPTNSSSLLPDRFAAVISAAEVEASKAKGTDAFRFFTGYLNGVRDGAEAFGSARFGLLESDAEGIDGEYGEGYRYGLLNIEFASA